MTVREAILTSVVIVVAVNPAYCQPIPPTPPAPPVAPPIEFTISDKLIRSPLPIAGQAPVMPSRPAKKVSEMGLEELLQSALQNHSEIVMAQARVRDAEMDLIRIRQQILVQIAIRRAEFEAARATYNEAKVRRDTSERMLKEKSISLDEAKAADLSLLKAKAEMSRVEASLAAAAAMAPPGVEDVTILRLFNNTQPFAYTRIDPSTFVPMAPAVVAPMPPTPVNPALPTGAAVASPVAVVAMTSVSPATPAATQKLLKKLITPVTLTFTDPTLADVIEALGQQIDLVTPLSKEKLAAKSGPANFKNLPLGAAMQWMEDSFKVKLIIRDYGIVVTEADRVPPGALSVMDVWRETGWSLQGGLPPEVFSPPAATPGKKVGS